MSDDEINLKHPILVILGPSGSGKSTINKRLTTDFPDTFELCISCTSRPIRDGEKDGVNYYYISNEEFDQMMVNDEFIETAVYVGFKYGTPRSELFRISQSGKVPILEIEIQGYKQLLDLKYAMRGVFIRPEGIDVLRDRLVMRRRDSDEAIKKRLERANQEIEESKNYTFDYILKNDDLEVAYKNLVDKLKEWYPLLKKNE